MNGPNLEGQPRHTVVVKNGNVPDAKQADYERGVALLLTVQHERDQARETVVRLEQAITVNRIEIEGLRAQLAEAQTRIQSYQFERDTAVAKAAQANARLEAIAEVVLGTVKARGMEIASEETFALTDGQPRTID